MKVVKVLNNSLVLALDPIINEEVIIMGKGIGFYATVGKDLSNDRIEKIYVLKDRDTKKKLIQLSGETDTEYFDLSSQIIQYAKEHHSLQLKDHIYLSLTDHISFIQKRMESGYVFQNTYIMDIQRLNPIEFDIANYGLELLRSELNSKIPDSELIYIAMHFVYQRDLNDNNTDYDKMNKIVEEVLNITKYQLQISYDKDSIVYSRFLTHLSLFAHRLVTNQLIPNKDTDILFEQFRESVKKEAECLEVISTFITEKYEKALSNQELLYLLIHIHKVNDEYYL